MLRFFSQKNPKKELEKRIGKFELPAFPEIADRGLQALRSDTSTLSEVGAIVAADPGISIKLLRIVNSASVGMRREVESVPQAVTLLGKAQVESLLTTIAVGQSIPDHKSEQFCRARFWQTASRRASVARTFAKTLHPAQQSLAYSAGLLQDMAIPVLSAAYGARYDGVLAEWRSERCELAELEKNEFGFDHNEIAGWMGASWNLPQDLIAAIASHHSVVGNDPAALASVNLSAFIREGDDDPNVIAANEEAKRLHGMDDEEALLLLQRAYIEAEEIAAIFTR